MTKPRPTLKINRSQQLIDAEIKKLELLLKVERLKTGDIAPKREPKLRSKRV